MKKYLPIILFGLALMIPSLVQAQTVTFSGSTFGVFGNSSPTYLDLAYTGSSFNVTTVNGEAAIGNEPTGTNNLGYFTLNTPASGSDHYTGQTFTLGVNFFAPPGAGFQFVPATLRGTVTSTGNGGVRITFDPGPNPNGSYPGTYDQGTYELFVDTINITSSQIGNPVAVTGYIVVNTVPEPASLALILPGLMPLGILLKRRKTASKRR